MGGAADEREPEEELCAFAQRLVATASPSGEEGEVAALLATELEHLGYEQVEVDAAGNVSGRLGEGRPRLMFNGHSDHVAPAGMDEPYGARIESGSRYGESGRILRGRGSCDMKANLAAGAYAARFLGADADGLSGAYLFTADVQEETDSPLGIQAMLERGIRADYGLSGESTNLSVSLGHRGKAQFDVTVAGRSSHASTPTAGLNAIYRAVPFLTALQDAASPGPSDPVFGEATLTVTGIQSEPREAVAVVPSACVIRVDRRYVPGESAEGCHEELDRLIAAVSKREGIPAEVGFVNDYPLMAIAAEDALVEHGCEAVRTVTGKNPPLSAWRFGVNATFMSTAGIPSIGIGPGDERWAHTPDEHVPLQQLVEASRIYAELIRRLCR